MSLIDIRKRCLIVETTFHEYGPPPAVPLKLAASCAVIRNPYAGRYEPDLMPFMAELRGLGTLLATELVDTLGKDSIEVQQGRHRRAGRRDGARRGLARGRRLGHAQRAGRAKAMVPAVKAVAVAGYRMMVPVHYIHASLCAQPLQQHRDRHPGCAQAGRDPVRAGHGHGRPRACAAGRADQGGGVGARRATLNAHRPGKDAGAAGRGAGIGLGQPRQRPRSAPAAASTPAGLVRVGCSYRRGPGLKAGPRRWRAGSGRGGHLQHFVVDRRGRPSRSFCR